MIVTDPVVLRQISKPTTWAEVEELNLVARLKLALESAWCKGYGLSAIQIGVPLRMAWYKLPWAGDVVLINPVITSMKNAFTHPGEGCLSIPYKNISTLRYLDVTYENTRAGDPEKGPEEERLVRSVEGVEAFIIQHEVDHMDGILMTDREYRSPEVGRNEACVCGSGKKYKKCCGR